MLVGNLDEFTKHRKFQLQFDAVDGRFEGRLVHVKVGVFNSDQCDVHQDTRHVDGKQVEDDLPAVALRVEF